MSDQKLPHDQTELKLWCNRRQRPHYLGGGRLTLVDDLRLVETFRRDDLLLLGATPEEDGSLRIWMGRLRAILGSAEHARDQAHNSGGQVDPDEPRALFYNFPFRSEPGGYSMPIHLTFGCKCGAYIESVPGLYRALRGGDTVSLRSNGGEPYTRIQGHDPSHAWADAAKMHQPKRD